MIDIDIENQCELHRDGGCCSAAAAADSPLYSCYLPLQRELVKTINNDP